MHNIEFHTPAGKVPEALIEKMRDELIKLFHLYFPISRAEVMMKEEETMLPEMNKVCEMRLVAFGEDLVVHSRSASFEAAVKQTMKELKRMVKQKVSTSTQVPDATTSSVKV